MIGIIVFFFVWYWLTRYAARLVCGGERDWDTFVTVWAGFFLLPPLAGLILLAIAEWYLRRYAVAIGMPFVEPASDNPMDYLV